MTRSALCAFLTACIMFAGCGKDDDGVSEISGVIDNAARFSEVTAVRIEAGYDDAGGGWRTETLAEAEFKSGRFAVKLPPTVDEKILRAISKDFSAPIVVSNTSAKWIQIWEVAGYKGNQHIADFWHGRYEETSTSEIYASRVWIYVDSNVKIEGTFSESGESEEGDRTWEESFTMALNLKKGWNIAYYEDSWIRQGNKDVVKETFTSKPVSGLKWNGWLDD